VLPEFSVPDKFKDTAQKLRGDLRGFWNDFKFEAGYWTGRGLDADTRLNAALDFLEWAEREGGLGTWLEQWNETVVSGQFTWDMLEESAKNIKQGIEFCKEMLFAGFGDLSRARLDNPSVQDRNDLRSALDAIALEIARQADELMAGRKLGEAHLLDAVTQRLRDQNWHAAFENDWHEKFQKGGGLGEHWLASHKDIDAQDTASSLDSWQSQFSEVSDIAQAIGDGQGPGEDAEIEAVRKLDKLAQEVFEPLLKYRNSYGDAWQGNPELSGRLAESSMSLLLSDVKVVAESIVNHQKQLAKELTSAEARDYLSGGRFLTGAYNLQQLVELGFEEPSRSVYTLSRRNAEKGTLGNFWRESKSYIINDLLKTRDSVFRNEMLANEITRTFNLNLDLGDSLDLWTKSSDPNVRYALYWELIATLRHYKVYIKPGHDEYYSTKGPKEYFEYVLDAITDAISARAKAEISGT
jgi:hypothetical protein